MERKTDLIVALLLKALSGAEKSSNVILRAKLKMAAAVLFALAALFGFLGSFCWIWTKYDVIVASFVMSIVFGLLGGGCLLWSAQAHPTKRTSKTDLDSSTLVAAFISGLLAPVPPQPKSGETQARAKSKDA